MERNQRKLRQPSPLLQLTPHFKNRLSALEYQGISFQHITRSIDVCGYRTLFNIRAGVARCTPTALCAVAIVAEIFGGLRRDLIVRGAIIPPPPVDLTIRALKTLATTSPQARAYVVRRLQQLEHVHAGFSQVERQR